MGVRRSRLGGISEARSVTYWKWMHRKYGWARKEYTVRKRQENKNTIKSTSPMLSRKGSGSCIREFIGAIDYKLSSQVHYKLSRSGQLLASNSFRTALVWPVRSQIAIAPSNTAHAASRVDHKPES